MTRYTAKWVLAMEFGWDMRDLEDYRYHYGRTDRPVYAIGDDYFCATPKGKQPAKHVEGMDWKWQEKPSTYAESIGWVIWRAKGAE